MDMDTWTGREATGRGQGDGREAEEKAAAAEAAAAVAAAGKEDAAAEGAGKAAAGGGGGGRRVAPAATPCWPSIPGCCSCSAWWWPCRRPPTRPSEPSARSRAGTARW